MGDGEKRKMSDAIREILNFRFLITKMLKVNIWP